MAVWLSMGISYVGPGDYTDSSKVFVIVDAYWNYAHFNRDGGSLTVTVDGVADQRTVPFNAGETSNGSQRIYSSYWNVAQPNGEAKTVYVSATFQATSNTTATPASDSLYLAATNGSGGGSSGGGSSGGDSGGSGGDSGGSNPPGGSGGSGGSGESGGGSGGASGDSDYEYDDDVPGYYIPVEFVIAPHSYIEVYRLYNYGSEFELIETVGASGKAVYGGLANQYYRFVFMVEDGYTLIGGKYNGINSGREVTVGTSADSARITLETVVEPSTSYGVSVTVSNGATVSLHRTSSEFGNIGQINSGDRLYLGDVLLVSISCAEGFVLDKATANGIAFASGDQITVEGNVNISVTAKRTTMPGLIHIDNGTVHGEYQIFIDNGTTCDEYEAYIDTGTSWEQY